MLLAGAMASVFDAQQNGPYRSYGHDDQQNAMGLIWNPYKEPYYSMKYARMCIKPTFNN